MPLRPAEEERRAGESAAGAGGASAKDTERAVGVFMALMCEAAQILIPMGGIVRRTEGRMSEYRRGQ